MAVVALGRYAEARDRLSQGVNTHPDEPTFAHALARLLAAAPDGQIRDGRRAMAVMQKLSNEQQRLDFGETVALTWRRSATTRRLWHGSVQRLLRPVQRVAATSRSE